MFNQDARHLLTISKRHTLRY